MGALARYASVDEPLIFASELLTWFVQRGMAVKVKMRGDEYEIDERHQLPFFAYEPVIYGLVNIRTDGERLIVYVGQTNEIYAYKLDPSKIPVRVPVEGP